MAMIQRRLPLTSLRGFRPSTVRLSAREITARWRRRFAEKGEGHPYFLHVHIPFCPQLCSFCQCSTEKLVRPPDLDEDLTWLEAELACDGSVTTASVAGFRARPRRRC